MGSEKSAPSKVANRKLTLSDLADVLAGAYPPELEVGDNSVITSLRFNVVPGGVWRVVLAGGAWADTEGTVMAWGIFRSGTYHILGMSDQGGDLAGVPTIANQVTIKKAIILLPGDQLRMDDVYAATAAVEGSIAYVDVLPQ